MEGAPVGPLARTEMARFAKVIIPSDLAQEVSSFRFDTE